MKIKFLGAASTVTGSCYLLTPESGQPILVDCGLFQGSQDLEKLNYLNLDADCSQICGMVLTHAHLDHCGRLPTLLSQKFNQKVLMTLPTRDLTELSLFDSAKVNKTDKKDMALYDKDQVTEIVTHFVSQDYETPFSLGNFRIIMRDAGHILGSASLEIEDQSAKEQLRKVVFSGDLGNSPEDLIRATELINSADAVVMESTYGDKIHPEGNPSDVIQSEINFIEQSNGTLLIPAFSLERSQELLHRISHLKKSGKIKNETAVFFDSPMAEKATVIFEKYYQLYNQELKDDYKTGDPFHFPGLNVIEDYNQSREIEKYRGPKVIIAGSGMMTGGRILGHAKTYLPQNDTRLLIVGYQAEGTLGRLILDGQRNVKIEGTSVSIKATINDIQTMSSHADYPKLLRWLKAISGVKKVFLTHGEDGPRTVLAEKIKSELGISDVLLPVFNQEVVI